MDNEPFADEEQAVESTTSATDLREASPLPEGPTPTSARAPAAPQEQQPAPAHGNEEVRESSAHSATESMNAEHSNPAASTDAEDHDGNEEQEENGEGEDGDGGYAAEYRSLLFRVADLAAQEGQRVRQSDFALRMTQREARLLTATAAQQQAYLSAHPFAGASPPAHEDDPRAALTASASPHATDLTSTVAADARLAGLAHRIDAAQHRQRLCTDAAELLSSYKRVLRADAAHEVAVQDVAAELLLRLCASAGLPMPAAQHDNDPAEGGEAGGGDGPFRGGADDAVPAASSDLWQKQANGLTTLGGTLAKVHALFTDAECRGHMSVVATALTEVGRQSQHLLQELQGLTAAELQLEADLAKRRSGALEWGLFAAHAQQAREMRDLYAPATVEEMRAMALRKVLLRRRQELQSALTVVLLREAERHCRTASAAAGSTPAAPPSSACCFASPPHEVTPETCKATADTCSRYEGLRDRLWRELLYLKKCARRELGPGWVAGAEACGLVSVTAQAAEQTDAHAVAVVLEEDLRRATYDGIARLLTLAATAQAAPLPGCGDREEAAEQPDGSGSRAATASAEAERATPSPPGSPSSVAESASADLPSPRLEARVRVLSQLEAVQTRANSLVALLVENAKHWQRTLDGVAEVRLCAGGSAEDAWRHTAELLLERCTAGGEDGAGASPGRPTAAEASPVLTHEQRLLDQVHTAQSAIVAAMNAAVARVRRECVAPLEKERQDVAVLLRLLQLADESVSAASSDDVVHRRAPASTPALEKTAQLLQTSGASSEDPLDGPRLCLPALPRRAETVQAALRPLSAASMDRLAATTAPLRAAVSETQAMLEQYAQYSMAEVPALLEKAQAATKELHSRLAESVARDSQSAALALDIEAQRTALTKATTTERAALSSAVLEARAEVAQLQARVAQLQAGRALQAAEAEARATAVCAAEAAAWQRLLQDAPQPESEEAADEQDEAEEAVEDDGAAAVTAEEAEAEQDTAVVVKKEEDDEEAKGVAADDDVGDAPPPAAAADATATTGDEVVQREDAEADEQEPEPEPKPEATGVEQDKSATASQNNASAAEATPTAAETSPEAEEEEEAPTPPENPQDEDSGALVKPAASTPPPPPPTSAAPPPPSQPQPTPPQTPQRTPPPPQPQQQPKVVSPQRPAAQQHKKQQSLLSTSHPQQQYHHQQQQQQPFMWSAQQHAPQGQSSILGDSMPGGASAGAPAQRPPVFGGPAGGSAFGPASTPALPQPVFSTAPTNRPVFETSPFFSNFGFEEEDG